MLTNIHIRDFTLIEALDLELAPGMTVLTGETGAGKSILVDALALALGERGGSNLVRPGRERADVTASFDVGKNRRVLRWLEHHDLADESNDCILRRVIGRDSRSKAFINGRPTTLQILRELGRLLVDIHSQHAHHSLMRREVQRELLDAFGGHGPEIEAVRTLHLQWQDIKRQLSKLTADPLRAESERDLLAFQISEFRSLGLGEEELAELDAEHHRLANAERLASGTAQAHGFLDGDDRSATSLIEQARRELADLSRFDPRLCVTADTLETIGIQVSEAASDLRRYNDALDMDSSRLEWVEQRLGTIHDLGRKHRVEPARLLERLEELERRLEHLDRAEESAERLHESLERARAEYGRAADLLRARRLKTAAKLTEAVSKNMQDLGMTKGRFHVDMAPLSDETPTLHGLDRLEFLVSVNPGQPLAALAKVASGGELSRISLAIQVNQARDSGVPTLIFDEVDVGIGGGIAERVGQKLRALGDKRQVLCITHLPQVAAQGQQHLCVDKQVGDENTRTAVSVLNDSDRVEEIARMLGGVELTDQTRAHAREMVRSAATP